MIQQMGATKDHWRDFIDFLTIANDEQITWALTMLIDENDRRIQRFKARKGDYNE